LANYHFAFQRMIQTYIQTYIHNSCCDSGAEPEVLLVDRWISWSCCKEEDLQLQEESGSIGSRRAARADHRCLVSAGNKIGWGSKSRMMQRSCAMGKKPSLHTMIIIRTGDDDNDDDYRRRWQ
jgi:hypothetical protein